MNTIILDKQGVILSIHAEELNPILVTEELRPYIKIVETITSEAIGKYKNDDGVYVYQEIINEKPDIVETIDRVIPVMEFKLKMTSVERVAIKELAKTDDIVSDFMEILDDQRLTEVNLNSDTILQSLNYLMTNGVISQERIEEITA